MRWKELTEAASANLSRGFLSGYPIANTGELGKLEDALCLWVEGSCSEAEPYLLDMRDLMKQYDRDHKRLYRGIVLDISEVRKAIREGITISHHRKSLESWAHDPEAVEEFMAGWDRPWIMVEAEAITLDTLIDLETFDRDAKPFTRMNSQAEVLVLASPEVYFPPDRISTPYGEDELRRYEQSLDA